MGTCDEEARNSAGDDPHASVEKEKIPRDVATRNPSIDCPQGRDGHDGPNRQLEGDCPTEWRETYGKHTLPRFARRERGEERQDKQNGCVFEDVSAGVLPGMCCDDRPQPER